VVYVRKEELEIVIATLHERGLNREEAAKVISEAIRESHSVENLSKKKDTSLLIKVGLLLIAFPDPTISDLVGTLLISAGLIQTKIRHSTLHVEDVPDTFQGVIKSLQAVRRELG
jgi:hypothetical protein